MQTETASQIKTEQEVVNPKQNDGNFTLLSASVLFCTLFFGGAAGAAFLVDLVGLPVQIWTVLPLTFLITVLGGWFYVKETRKNRFTPDFAAFIGFWLIVAGFFVYSYSLGQPDQLPVGTTVDAVHQYGLADYILQSGRLPIHANEQRANLQDGLTYPPAYVILAALGSQLTGVELIYILYPLATLFGALATAGTFAVATLLMPDKIWRLPLAALAAGFTLLPHGYTFGAFTSQNYFAQIVGGTFLVFALYFLLVWRVSKSYVNLISLGVTLTMLILAYPTFALVGVAAFGLVALLDNQTDWRGRFKNMAWLLLPVGIFGLLFLKDRLAGGVDTVSNEGDVLYPDLNRYSWLVAGLALLGLELALLRGSLQGRILALFSGLLAAEGVGLWLVKLLFDRGSYYAIHKLFYTATFFIALLAVYALHWIFVHLALQFRARDAERWTLGGLAIGTLIFGGFLAATWTANPTADRPYSVITKHTYEVGKWAAANLKPGEFTTAYALPPGTPAYWLQIGLLKQPRGVRSNDLLTREPETFQSWFYAADSAPYLVTDDLENIKTDERVAIIQRTGNVGILNRTATYTQSLKTRPYLTLRYDAKFENNGLALRMETSQAETVSGVAAGVAIAASGNNENLWKATLAPETGRARRQFLGLNLNLTNLQLGEFYANNRFPDKPKAAALPPGRYTAYMLLEKENNALDRRKLFDFEVTSGKVTPDFGGGALKGQFFYETAPPDTFQDLASPARFELNGEIFELQGLNLPPAAQIGSEIGVRLKWQTPIASSQPGYGLRISWLDENGQPVGVQENIGAEQRLPVWLWSPGAPAGYSTILKMPSRAGKYQMALTLVDPADGKQSPIRVLPVFIDIAG
jgi:hypothetical protein